jgi:hypothetical protein
MGKKNDDPFGIKTREQIAIKRSEEILKEGTQIPNDKLGEIKHEKYKPTAQASDYSCTLIIQKIEEWKKILKNAERDKTKSEDKELLKIQKKIKNVCDIIYYEHGSSKYPNEVVSKLYYNNKKTIDKIRRDFKSWEESTRSNDYRAFLNSFPRAKERLEAFLINKEEGKDLEDVLLTITAGDAYETAVFFTHIDTGLSEERIKHKIKNIYKQYD